MAETIGEWTPTQLVRFIQEQLRQSPPVQAPNLTSDDLTVTKKLSCLDQLQFYQNQYTVGAAGTASALPANPLGYFRILDFTGNVRAVPYYNAT